MQNNWDFQVVETFTGKPYKQIQISDKILRVFSCEVDYSELVWHRDKMSRKVTVVSGCGWFLQLDNQAPIELKSNMDFDIPREVYHRLIKSNSCVCDLVVAIEEY